MKTDAVRYKPEVVWRTLAKKVHLLTKETEEEPATYRMTVDAVDSNELKHGQLSDAYNFWDNVGNPYKIIAVNGSEIDVKDIFRTGFCPTSGKIGVIYKSVWKGRALYLPPVCYQFLHPIALQRRDQFILVILWSNVPNPKRIPFTNSNNPKIEDYQGTQQDGFCLAEDYGESPFVQLWQIDSDGNIIERTEKPYFKLNAEDLIDSIVFADNETEGIGETISGYILIRQ